MAGTVPSSRIGTARVGDVRLDDLIGTQRRVTVRGVEKHLLAPSADDLPLVYQSSDGKAYVADGHHRLTAARLRGERTARVRIVDVGRIDE